MFGKNEITKPFRNESGHLRVTEIFRTIQGEGPDAGTPAVFVRLAKCNLACTFCFVGNTYIDMAEGPRKKIRDVKVGDVVIAYDERDNLFKRKKVTRVYKSSSSRILRVSTGKGFNPGDMTFCTPEHPFLVKGRGWTAAQDLRDGDILLHRSVSDLRKINNPLFDPDIQERVGRQLRSKAARLRSSARMAITMSDPVLLKRIRHRMTTDNPMKDPSTVLRAFLTREDRGHKTGPEKRFELATAGLPIRFVGDGSLVIGYKVPDFEVPGRKKVIEVWSADALHARQRGPAWRRARARLFAKYGYETLFVPMPPSGVRTGLYHQIRHQVSDFIRNGEKVLSVRKIQKGSKAWIRLAGGKSNKCPVYNLEVEGCHTYVANGKIVHNCDTEFERGDWWDSESLLGHVKKLSQNYHIDLVVITGGEPLLQNLHPFITLCNRSHFRVSIESAGTVWDINLNPLFSGGINRLVISPKTPKIDPDAILCLDVLKYIIGVGNSAEDDGLPVLSTQIAGKSSRVYRHSLFDDVTIYVQPMDEGDPVKNAANAKLAAEVAMRFGYKLSIQVHKVVGLP